MSFYDDGDDHPNPMRAANLGADGMSDDDYVRSFGDPHALCDDTAECCGDEQWQRRDERGEV